MENGLETRWFEAYISIKPDFTKLNQDPSDSLERNISNTLKTILSFRFPKHVLAEGISHVVQISVDDSYEIPK